MSHSIIPPGQRLAAQRRGSGPWRAANDFVSRRAPNAGAPARGDGHPVIVFPGLGASGVALAPLRQHCHALGHPAFDWARGYRTLPDKNFNDTLSVLAGHTDDLLARFEQDATLIGWSLGGLYAREVAKLVKSQVRQVITIGTPFNAATDRASARWLSRLLDGATSRCDPDLIPRLRTPPPVPTTSIYSRSDGVVGWLTCRHGEESRWVQDVEIDGSHIGLGWNPDVLRVVADRLAQRPGEWRPYAGDGARAARPMPRSP